MKKEGIVLAIFLVIVLLNSSGVFSADSFSDASEGISDNLERTKEVVEGEKWKYIGEQWKELILNNKYLAGIDSFFRSINFLFLFLFGENYDVSLTLLMVILLWFLFFFFFSQIFLTFSALSKLVSIIVGFLLTLISAQIGFFRETSEFIFKVMFFKEGWWPWLGVILLLIIYFILFALISKIFMKARITKRNEDRQSREKVQKIEQKSLHQFSKGVDKGLT